MKRLLSLTLLMSAVHLHAADNGKKTQSMLSAAASVLGLGGGVSSSPSAASSTSTDEVEAATPAAVAAAGVSAPELPFTDAQLDALERALAARRKTRGAREEATEFALAGASGAATELLGEQGPEQLAALMAKLQAAAKDPSLSNILTSAQLTTQMVNQLAPLFNADGLEKVKKGCMAGVGGLCAKKQAAAITSSGPDLTDLHPNLVDSTAVAAAPDAAATRGQRGTRGMVKIRCTAEQADAVGRLLGAISANAPQPVALSSQEASLATRALALRQAPRS